MQEVDDFYAQKRKITSNQITEQDLIEKTENNDPNDNTKKVISKKIKNEVFEKNLEKFKKQLIEELQTDFDKMNNKISKIEDEVKHY